MILHGNEKALVRGQPWQSAQQREGVGDIRLKAGLKRIVWVSREFIVRPFHRWSIKTQFSQSVSLSQQASGGIISVVSWLCTFYCSWSLGLLEDRTQIYARLMQIHTHKKKRNIPLKHVCDIMAELLLEPWWREIVFCSWLLFEMQHCVRLAQLAGRFH